MAHQTDQKPDPQDGFANQRQEILRESLKIAPFEGWNRNSLDNAATAAGVEKTAISTIFPHGVADLMRFWSHQLDEQMTSRMMESDIEAMKIREKVETGVLIRLETLSSNREAARRAAGWLAIPPNHFLASRLTWNTADAIWRAIGDKSTDFNYYSKRTILSGVWTSTLARWFADDTEDQGPTRDFLAARIENVMQFEKAKSKAKKLGLNPAAPIEFLARLRYPMGK